MQARQVLAAFLTAATCAASVVPATYAEETEAVTEVIISAESETESDTEEAATYYVTANLNIRSGPSTDATWVGMYNAGDEILVYSFDGDWAKTDLGWVYSLYITSVNGGETTTDDISERTVGTGLSFEEKVAAFAEEYENAEYKHQSDTLFVTINQNTYVSGSYYLTHVIISDPSQIKESLSNSEWGETRQQPTSVASETGAIVVTNGSYFSYDTGQPASGNVFISNGTIMKDGTTNGKEVCLKSDGTLYTPESGISASTLLTNGVVSNWGTSDPLLISDGESLDLSACSTKAYPRTAYGMVEPCEYYIITAGSANYADGLTFQQLQEIFLSLGCTYGRSLDGGGSSSLVFEGTLLNTPAAGEERPVADFVYFTD